MCKNLFLCNRQKTNFYLLMMPGDKPFKTKELSHQLGIARLSFASPEDMEQYLDCTPGSSSIMGLANDAENKVQLLMDEDIKAGEYLGCHPCINTSSLKLRTADVLETFLPAAVSYTHLDVYKRQEPHVNNNWKIVGNNWKAADHQKAVQLLREGKLALNENADARTLPGKAITCLLYTSGSPRCCRRGWRRSAHW